MTRAISNFLLQRQTIPRRSNLFALVSLFGLSAGLAGCVSGPSAYFKQVSQETVQARTSQDQQDVLLIEPVQITNLPSATPNPQSTPNTQLSDVDTLVDPANTPLDIASNQSNTQAQTRLTAQTAYTPIDQNLPRQNWLGQPIGGLEQSAGFAIGSASEPVIDPAEAAAEARIPLLYSSIRHGQCKSGRGPLPRKISATNIVPGDPYYIEIRMRHTPLLPVGHTYVAYGRLSGDGRILDERLIMLAPVGGYAGAALASGVPMPGILNPHPDDCRIRPKTAYRVSLNAQRYEKLLKEVQKARAEKPSYLLFAYNCNHFMTRMAKSVGIRPPKNIYVPAVEYIYAMIEENEGRKISRR